MPGRTKHSKTRDPNAGIPAPAADRISYIRAFRVRDWVRAACELRPMGGLPAVSISRQRGQRPL